MREITIIGGGIAGLSHGILLRRAGIPVTLFEAGSYPRHKVCGEFVSGMGQTILSRLRIDQVLPQARIGTARTCALFTARHASPTRHLSQPATCVSRYDLDLALAKLLELEGGRVVTGQRRAFDGTREGVVYATGRRLRGGSAGTWYGLKVHAYGVCLAADLEMHLLSNGYVGFCRLPEGSVNVCGLFRKDRRIKPGSPLGTLKGEPGSLLFERLAHADFDQESLCAVAGISFRAPGLAGCAIGDAIRFIPPATGNGISVALESAGIAAPVMAGYATGQLSWAESTREAARLFEKAFRRRMVWGRALHKLLIFGGSMPAVARVLMNSDVLWKLFFSATRSFPFRGKADTRCGDLCRNEAA